MIHETQLDWGKGPCLAIEERWEVLEAIDMLPENPNNRRPEAGALGSTVASQPTVAQIEAAPNSPSESGICSPHRIDDLMKDTVSPDDELNELIKKGAIKN